MLKMLFSHLFLASNILVLSSIQATVNAESFSNPRANNQSNIISVRVANVSETAAIGGTVVPYKEITLAAQMPGRIEFISGNEGDSYKKDDLLITISDESLLAKRKAAIFPVNVNKYFEKFSNCS